VIYFAASDGKNENHLAYALQSKTDDPLGEYDLHGPFDTGDFDAKIWAIDMTPLEHEGKLYAIWSGWDAPGTDQQFLYIAPMKSPTELAGKRVRICSNDDYRWEFTEGGDKGRGLNEGPQVLQTGERTFVTYSCGASWLPTYKLGMLELTGDDPLDPASWKKSKGSVFQGTEKTYGVGHSCFVKTPNSGEWWHVYHAKRDPNPGWRRAIFVQPMKVDQKGTPHFGKPVEAGEAIPRPAGDKLSWLESPYRSDLKAGFSYFGHHQYFQSSDGGLRIGGVPEEPINEYRSGEKIVLDAQAPDDFVASVRLNFEGNAEGRGAGLLFRVSGPSVGYDAHRGYFASVKPSQNVILFGKMDGASWQELQRVKKAIDTGKEQFLEVIGDGSDFTVKLDGETVLTQSDSTYKSGTVGLRVVDIPVVFSDLQVKAATKRSAAK
jgi:GH43 family beta-xylosidase